MPIAEVIDLATFRRASNQPTAVPSRAPVRSGGVAAPRAAIADPDVAAEARRRQLATRKAAAIEAAMTALETALQELLTASDELAHAGDPRFRAVDRLSERVAAELRETVRVGRSVRDRAGPAGPSPAKADPTD